MAYQLHPRCGCQPREPLPLETIQMSKMRYPLPVGLTRTAALLTALTLVPLGSAMAQAERRAVSPSFDGGIPEDTELNALERGRYAVLIDLDENLLHFKEGDVVLWSAPVGTGTGMRVITDDDDWEFSTPTGRFQVQYKEPDPVWIAPDWYFVENNRPIPPVNDPSRVFRNSLGVAAVYISPHLAIHGTDRPELIGQRVSHGCIRLENRYALRLFNNVQVGTEVIIVGGEDVVENARVVDLREGYDASLASQGRQGAAPVDDDLERWTKLGTHALLTELDEQLALGQDSQWDQLAALLVERAADDDGTARLGLLSRAGNHSSSATEREWGTMLTELFRRDTMGTLETLADLPQLLRQEAADLLVSASVSLFAGDPRSVSTPWPSNRIAITPESRRARSGQEAIAAAEQDHRERVQGELASR